MATARVLSQVEELAKREFPYQTVATIGRLEVRPNAINVVPGEVSFTVDVRGVDVGSRHRLIRQIQRAVAREVASRGMSVSVQILKVDEPVLMSAGLQRILTDACTQLGVPHMLMPSMAGHDASVRVMEHAVRRLAGKNVPTARRKRVEIQLAEMDGEDQVGLYDLVGEPTAD